MADIDKHIKNAYITAGGLCRSKSSAQLPKEYKDRKRQYYGDATRKFIEAFSEYSSDFFEVEIQGLDPKDKYKWKKCRARMADAIMRTSVLTRKIDDFKQILVVDSECRYIPEGAKVKAMGSTWISINPSNISGTFATSIIRRCRAVWNHYDYYGNIVSEPICIDKLLANANDSRGEDPIPSVGGYFNIICQYNSDTAQLDTNSRIILGGSAYYITGYSDYFREFTDDESSVRLLEFSARREEINKEIDDAEKKIAGGKNQTFKVDIYGKIELYKGEATEYTAEFYRNGEKASLAAEEYVWQSSDESIIRIDESGAAEAVGAGSCQITATLLKNKNLSAAINAEVKESAGKHLEFIGEVPKSIAAFKTATLRAALIENGIYSDKPLKWEFSGAEKGSYTAETDINTAQIKCFGQSAAPLTVTVSESDMSITAEIELEGF